MFDLFNKNYMKKQKDYIEYLEKELKQEKDKNKKLEESFNELEKKIKGFKVKMEFYLIRGEER